jgi:hypothetical protein
MFTWEGYGALSQSSTPNQCPIYWRWQSSSTIGLRMGKYHNDQPIQGGINDPDLLNRLGFANNLANVLLLNHDDDCLTVSLEGEWGRARS